MMARLRAELLWLGFTVGDFIGCAADVTDSPMGLGRLGALPMRTVAILSGLIEAFQSGTVPTGSTDVCAVQGSTDPDISSAQVQDGAR